MDKFTIIVRVQGINKSHVFRVPPSVHIGALIDRFADDLGIAYPKSVKAVVDLPLDTPFREFQIGDNAEILLIPNEDSEEIELVETKDS